MTKKNWEFTVRLRGVEEDQYADIINTVWMQLRAIGGDFAVIPDRLGNAAALDARWDSYSEVSWTAGGRGGTPQAKAARKRRSTDSGQ
ncbi:hypothetical protein [Micromonospora antibiotica]|uniref:Antibiotic biosynthesis monooxygenase n=1 Tax=Micromonospora antibiotica TaxID=2807623 RepID=A0ABS3VI21_9ACTN|nr:hypothetical protein [Micromonospora antibiotica]MBO4165280.1 hypothetical protein [Micromonospora antibiotica]